MPPSDWGRHSSPVWWSRITIVVDTLGNTIVSKTLGSKALAIRSATKSGTVREEKDRANEQALSDGQILELAALGKQVEVPRRRAPGY